MLLLFGPTVILGSVCTGLWIRLGLRIRILLYLAVAFNMPKKDFFSYVFLLISFFRSHKRVEIMVYLFFFLLADGRIRILTNNYGSGS
jgi:hypothetical protein